VRPETAQLRRDVADLADQAHRDLAGLWAEVASAAAAQKALFEILPDIVDAYGADAAAVAALWYDEVRDKYGVPGRYFAKQAPLGDLGANALIGWASATAVDVVKDGTVTSEFRSLIEGGTQRRIANMARRTVMRSSVRDPRGQGWARVGNPKCNFCRMLIGRVYRSEDSADFRSHDGCNCAAEPEWR
jgi:hypothetical protein